MNDMSPHEKIRNTAFVFKVKHSRLDNTSAPIVRARLAALIREGHRRIAVEMSEVDFIDSRGLGVLVSAARQLGDGGDFVISAPRNTVLCMFKLTRLHRVFRIFDDERQAVAALQSSEPKE
jgi:anti-sigma B factor antagonist